MRARANMVCPSHQRDLRIGLDQPRTVDGREEVLFRAYTRTLSTGELGVQRGKEVRPLRERVEDRIWVSWEEFAKYSGKLGCISKRSGVVHSPCCVKCGRRGRPHRLQRVFLRD